MQDDRKKYKDILYNALIKDFKKGNTNPMLNVHYLDDNLDDDQKEGVASNLTDLDCIEVMRKHLNYVKKHLEN